jgi:FkbM family methyltransferase
MTLTGVRKVPTPIRRWKVPIQRVVRQMGYELTALEMSEVDHVARLIGRLGIDLLIDVGANQGQYATRFRQLGYEGEIVSFEPMGDAYSALAKASGHDERWQARQLAVGAENGTATLHVSENSVSSSLLDVGETHVAAAPSSHQLRDEEVAVTTLDDALRDTPFTSAWLKIDTQGFEDHVLAGASETLSRVSVVQCELSLVELYVGQPHFLDVFQRIDSLGFRTVRVTPGFSDPSSGDLLQFDVTAARV